MFMSSKRNLVRDKIRRVRLWGLGLEQGKSQLDHERLELEKAKPAHEKYRFEEADGSSLWGNTLRLFAMVLGLGSLLLFAGGISHANDVFAAFS